MSLSCESRKEKNSLDFKYTREKMVVEEKDETSDRMVKEESKDASRRIGMPLEE